MVGRVIDKLVVVRQSDDVSAAELDRQYRREGFLMCGFHFVVRSEGSIERSVRPLSKAGCFDPQYDSTGVGVLVCSLKPSPDLTACVNDILKQVQQQLGRDVEMIEI